MKAVCIVQARRGSSRLPDKILKPIGHTTALESCLKRCLRIPGIDEVVCAGVDRDTEQPVFDAASSIGCTVSRGSETDVLARYHDAARSAQADLVMRVTSDCPLIDPDVCGQLLAAVQKGDYDYGTLLGFSHGLDCEVFTMKELERAHKEASASMEREHVTLGIKSRPENRIVHLNCPEAQRPTDLDVRLVLDYPEDLAYLQTLFELAGAGIDAMLWTDIISLMRRYPEKLARDMNVAGQWIENTRHIIDMAEAQGVPITARAAVGLKATIVDWVPPNSAQETV